jgi:protein-arginine kinase activator protein McsA
MAFISQKLRNSAKGQDCQFKIPGVCNCDSSTVVLCHLPSHENGMAMKSPDYLAAFGCSECHFHFDQNKLDPLVKEQTARRAHAGTMKIWLEMGLMSFPQNKKRKRPVGKIMQSTGIYRSV